MPHGHWKTGVFVAGLRADGIVPPFVFDQAVNGAIFRQYVGELLAPTLKPGDVVVMDNSPHTRPVASARRSRRTARR